MKYDDSYIEEHGKQLFKDSSAWYDEKIKPQMVADSYQYDSLFTKKSRSNTTRADKLFIPKTYSVVDRLLVDVLDSIFSDMDNIVTVTSWKTIPSLTKDIVSTLLNYRLNGNPINLYNEI